MQRECAVEGAAVLQNMQMEKGASHREGGDFAGASSSGELLL